jgi:hypothetical protein
MQFRPFILANPNPRTNALEFFQSNRSIRAFGFLYDLFADLVVKISSKERFFLASLAQSSLGALSFLRLQPLAQLQVALSQIFDVAARKRLSIRVIGDGV